MAGASTKKITAGNIATIKLIRLGFIISNAIYVLSLFIFSSNRTVSRSIYYIITEIIGLLLWKQLESMKIRGEDLNVKGLTSSFYDIIYITWIVHIGTALISKYFWYLYLSIPIYAIYKLSIFILPYLLPFLTGSNSSSTSSVPSREKAFSRKATKIEEDQLDIGAGESLSKRQIKLNERAKKGPIRIGQQSVR